MFDLPKGTPADERSGLELGLVLQRPEEIFERLAVVNATLKRYPNNEELQDLRSACLRSLGIDS